MFANLLYAQISSASLSDFTLMWMAVVCVLACFVAQALLRRNLRVKVAQLLRVTAAAREFRIDGQSATERYPDFRQCRKCLIRAVESMDGRNYKHAEELYYQALSYVSAVDKDVMAKIMEAAEKLQLPELQSSAAPGAQSEVQSNVPTSPKYRHDTSTSVRSSSRPPEAWDLPQLIARIEELSSRHDDIMVTKLMAPYVVELLKSGGESTAYARLRALKAALLQLDPSLAETFMTAVSRKYREVLHAAHGAA